jgi:hypothetical protein
MKCGSGTTCKTQPGGGAGHSPCVMPDDTPTPTESPTGWGRKADNHGGRKLGYFPTHLHGRRKLESQAECEFVCKNFITEYGPFESDTDVYNGCMKVSCPARKLESDELNSSAVLPADGVLRGGGATPRSLGFYADEDDSPDPGE